MLILGGISIDSEEELEYWISKLERESLQRLAIYFFSKNEMKFSRKKLKFVKTSEKYSLDDLVGLNMIAKSINKLIQKKAPLDTHSDEYKQFLKKAKFFKKLEQMIQKDIDARKNKIKNNKNNKNKKVNPWEVLKEKMISENVTPGSPYWNNVRGDFTASSDKMNFATSWQKDATQEAELNNPSLEKEQLDKLRGVENKDKDKADSKDKSENNKEQAKDNNQGKQNNKAPAPTSRSAQASR